MKVKIKKCIVCRKDYEIEAVIDSIEVQLLASWSVQGNEIRWHIMYGDRAEAVGADYGDDVEQEIEDIVVRALQKLGIH